MPLPPLRRLPAGAGPANRPFEPAVLETPSPQTQLDLFRGEWASAVPTLVPTTSGPREDLFDDPRVAWVLDQMGPVRGWEVCELGPLEGGHTTMLERAGARVVAVEADPSAFLRCLVVKNLLGLQARFECGDGVAFLRHHDRRYDLVLALDVLNHLRNPLELLTLVARRAGRLALWTHYWEPSLPTRRPDLAARFRGSVALRHGALQATGRVYDDGGAGDAPTISDGSRPTATWLSRDDLLAALEAVGFDRPRVHYDEPDHPHGPAISLVTCKS